jgi:hypothetical protein
MITATRTVRPGDTETSCTHCRYFTGHTTWCRMGKAEAAETAAIAKTVRTVKARRVDLYVSSTPVVGAVIRTTVNVEDGAGWWKPEYRYGRIERVENGRTVVRFPDGTWTYGPSGRVSVR